MREFFIDKCLKELREKFPGYKVSVENCWLINPNRDDMAFDLMVEHPSGFKHIFTENRFPLRDEDYQEVLYEFRIRIHPAQLELF